MILALALSPSLDLTYEVDRLHPGDITRPIRTTHVAGGKALNVARVARALGADVHVVAALGGHSGAWIADLLAEDDVPTTVVTLAQPTRMCAAIVESGARTSSTDLYEAATAMSSAEWVRFRDAALGAAAARWIALSGSVPPGVDAADVAALLAQLRGRGARVAVDSSGAGLRAAGPVADLVKVNRAEAEEFLGTPQPDASAAASALVARFGGDAIVTDGTRPGHAILAGTGIPIPPPVSLGRFSAGSGDAFLGGLLAALDAGDDPHVAVAGARDAATRNALVPGQGVLAPA